MTFKFDSSLEEVSNVYEKWWNNEIERSMVPVIIYGYNPDRPKPKCLYQDGKWLNGCTQGLFANKNVSAKEIVDCIEYELGGLEFLGDSFPMISMDFTGPGIAAAFLGGSIKLSNGGIWFYSEKETELSDMHLKYDPDNYWLNRIKEITKECKCRFGNDVVLGMPDIGGVIDILASLRDNNNLLFDLIDCPQEVKRLINEISNIWKIYYREISEIYCKDNYYTNWGRILSKKSSYMFQADFAYMLGPSMFDEFILPELSDNFSNVNHACYHLDGTGQLAHLDSLLSLESLKLVQWIPGSGTAPVNHWVDVYSKILDAGKKLQICDGFREEQLDKIIETRGTLKGVVNHHLYFDKKDRNEGLRFLEKYK